MLRRKILERELRDRGWPPERISTAAWDKRNRLPVCDQCHLNHHNGTRRLPIDLVVREAPKAIQFARELDMLEALKRDYDQEER